MSDIARPDSDFVVNFQIDLRHHTLHRAITLNFAVNRIHIRRQFVQMCGEDRPCAHQP